MGRNVEGEAKCVSALYAKNCFPLSITFIKTKKRLCKNLQHKSICKNNKKKLELKLVECVLLSASTSFGSFPNRILRKFSVFYRFSLSSPFPQDTVLPAAGSTYSHAAAEIKN